MLKRPSTAIKWIIALSIPLGLIAFLPAAAWAYAELGHFQFTPWVWLAGLQHQVQPRNLLLAGLAGGGAAIGLPGLVAWTLLPPKPLHGGVRNSVFLDGHTAARKVLTSVPSTAPSGFIYQ